MTGLIDLDQNPGCCAFCDQPIVPRSASPGRKRYKCDDPECERAYHKAYDYQRRGQKLFDVEDLVGESSPWSQQLSCGHLVEAITWAQRKAKRRRCPECAEKAERGPNP